MSTFHTNTIKQKREIDKILTQIEKNDITTKSDFRKLIRMYPKDNKGIFTRDELISRYQELVEAGQLVFNQKVLDTIKMKPTRTISGVAPVTVLTKPFPCPGKCIFCPTDVRMPKSYLSSEPGAQRAARNRFDPYLQTYNRLLAFQNTGHNTDKIELIILGGTWSYYPPQYQRWFIKRCLQAMNDFPNNDGREHLETEDSATNWEEINEVQKINETAITRNVGLVIETRPDFITVDELVELRKLGVTKVQIGVQSLNDEILRVNGRGHKSADIIKAVNILRSAGFKIHIHWMPNLFGATVEMDKVDYKKIWQHIMPDEMKIYPTSIIAGTVLYNFYKQGRYQPYTYNELLDLLMFCFKETPRYCRLTRIVRDIPAGDIVDGNKHSNFRQIAEEQLSKQGEKCNCIRCREIKAGKVQPDDLEIEEIEYITEVSTEIFISYKTKSTDRIVGFLRLSLPSSKHSIIPELTDNAIIREVHVYGQVVGIGNKAEGKAQHLGLGTSLINRAKEISKKSGYKELAVIAAIGTREYYRKLRFADGALFMHYYL